MKHILLLISLMLSSLASATPEDVTLKMRAEWLDAKIRDPHTAVAEKMQYLDSLISLGRGTDMRLLYRKVNLLYDLGHYKAALRLCDSIEPLVPRDSLDFRLNLQWSQGMLAFTLNDYSTAIKNAYGIIHHSKPDTIRYTDIKACAILSDIFLMMKNYRLGHKYTDMALSMLDRLPASSHFTQRERERLKGVFHRGKAELFIGDNMPDSAYAEINIAGSFCYDEVDSIISLTSLADILARRGVYRVADDYFCRAIAIGSHNFARVLAIVRYVRMLLQQRKPDAAMRVMGDHPDDIDKIPGTVLEKEHLENMGKYYSLKGDYRNEALTLRRLIKLTDSINNSTSAMAAREIAERYETMDTSRELSRLTADARGKLWIIAALLSVLLLILAVTLVIIRRLRRKKRESRSLEARIEQLGRDHDSAVRETEESLEKRSKELASMTIYMARLNEALSSIRRETADVSAPGEQRMERIRAIVRTLEREENVWEMFRVYFEQVNQTFFDRLFRLCPSLTNAETRMCAFILLNLTAKETATLTGRSPRTVDTIRHNLRKKLGITGSSEAFMRQISTLTPDEFDRMLHR